MSGTGQRVYVGKSRRTRLMRDTRGTLVPHCPVIADQQVAECRDAISVVGVAQNAAQPETVVPHAAEWRHGGAAVDRPDVLERLGARPSLHAGRGWSLRL